MSMPAEMPAEVTIAPWSTQRTPPCTRTAGRRARSASRSSQCEVACSPSSTPACASSSDPVQTDARMRAVRACAAIHAISAGWPSSASTTPPGTMAQSSGGWSASPWSGCRRSPARARTGPGWRAIVVTENSAGVPGGCDRASTRAAVVKTSYGPAMSSSSTSSNTRMPTFILLRSALRCGDRRTAWLQPAVAARTLCPPFLPKRPVDGSCGFER